MKASLLLLITLLLLHCKPQSLQDILLQKIEIFERNEVRYFENTTLQALRNARNQNPLEFQMTRNATSAKAVFQVRPKQLIFKNFYQDSIQAELIRVIDSLGIRSMCNFGAAAQLEFYHQEVYVILYRGKPCNRLAEFENALPISVIGNWKYFAFKLQSN